MAWSLWKPSTWSSQPPPQPGDTPKDAGGGNPPLQAPERAAGILGWLASIGAYWPGASAAAADLKTPARESDDDTPRRSAARELAWELTNSGPAGVIMPAFLPWFDEQTGETAGARAAYRKMLADGDIKSALLSKILPVTALDLTVQPDDDDDPLQAEIAAFIEWVFTRRLDGGWPGLVWDILIGGLVDGFSVLEKVWEPQARGKYRGKWVLSALKPKQVGDDIVPLTDQHRNVTGFRGLRYNAGQEWPPERFVHFRHLPMYGSPVGMSDLRAAYKEYWMLDTAKKLHAVFMEKRAIPTLWGRYKSGSQKPSLDAALAAFKSQNHISTPDDVLIDVIESAGGADSVFQGFQDARIEAIYRSINGASLQAVEGKTGGARGNSKVHESTAEVRVWHLSACIEALLNNYKSGLITDLTDLNYTLPEDAEYARAGLGAVDIADMEDDLKVYQGVQGLGLALSEADVRKRFKVPAPDKTKEGDAVKPPGGGGGPPPEQDGPGGPAGPMGGPEGGKGDPGADAGGDDSDPFGLRGGGDA